MTRMRWLIVGAAVLALVFAVEMIVMHRGRTVVAAVAAVPFECEACGCTFGVPRNVTAYSPMICPKCGRRAAVRCEFYEPVKGGDPVYGWSGGFDDGMKPLGFGAIGFGHLGNPRQHVRFAGRGQRLHPGIPFQKPPVIGDYRLGASLLQHDLRDPDAIRIAGTAPGQIAVSLSVPRQQQSADTVELGRR